MIHDLYSQGPGSPTFGEGSHHARDADSYVITFSTVHKERIWLSGNARAKSKLPDSKATYERRGIRQARSKGVLDLAECLVGVWDCGCRPGQVEHAPLRIGPLPGTG